MSASFSKANIKNYDGNSVAAFVIQDKNTNKFLTSFFDFSTHTYKTSSFIIQGMLFETFEIADKFRDENLSYGDFKVVMITISLGDEF